MEHSQQWKGINYWQMQPISKKTKMNLKKNLLEVRIVATSVGCGINRKGELPKVIEVFCILI